jgi:hypothetical protein
VDPLNFIADVSNLAVLCNKLVLNFYMCNIFAPTMYIKFVYTCTCAFIGFITLLHKPSLILVIRNLSQLYSLMSGVHLFPTLKPDLGGHKLKAVCSF